MDSTPAGFIVYTFFVGGEWQRACAEPLDDIAAVRLATTLVGTLGAKIGSTCRIIITDLEGYVVWEWRYGDGLVFPALRRKPVASDG